MYMHVFSEIKSPGKIKNRPQNAKDKAQIAFEKISWVQHTCKTYSVEPSSTH